MAVRSSGGHIIVERSGAKIWGTDAPPVNLLIANQIVVTVPVTFPEFSKDWVYGFNRKDQSDGDFPPTTYHLGFAMIMSKILPQDWSASQVIGSVPASCNYIDVRVAASWVNPPDWSFGSPVATPLSGSGGWPVHLQGGSSVLEIGNGFRRAIHVGLSGTSVILSRYQSAKGGDPLSYSSWGGPTQTGWSYLSSSQGSLQNKIGEKSKGSTSGTWVPPYRGGSDPATVTAPDDHSSTWSMQFIITPGRINASV